VLLYTTMIDISDDLKTFSREVRRRREALGLTLEELAERSGLTPNYIGTIENGHRDPSMSSVIALAAGLGVDVTTLFGQGGLSASAWEFGRLLDRAPRVLRALALRLLSYMTSRRRQKGR
jgi:transcriptional regulator with XRE-family HTH domain